MKDLIKMAVYCAAGGFGMYAGMWLWEAVAAEKAEDLKDSLVRKFSKNEEGA